jgi:hypothetical protein
MPDRVIHAHRIEMRGHSMRKSRGGKPSAKRRPESIKWFSVTKPLLLLTLAAAPAFAQSRIGAIDFFGYKGIDVAAVRAALTVHPGDEVNASTQDSIRAAVAKAIGKQPTDVNRVCCDEHGAQLIFIGLPGESYRRFDYNAKPTGTVKLPQEIVELNDKFKGALMAAVTKGGDATQEDDSQGYAMFKDSDLRKVQMSMRDWALKHEAEVLRAMDAAPVRDRQIASLVLGYANPSKEQIATLLRATRDPDDDVRNNATRALGAMLRSGIKPAAEIPAEGFIAMLNSGVWTDRNKASAVLWSMTAAREPALLAKLRAEALDSLIEMASWNSAQHAFMARFILGRIAGMEDQRIVQIIMSNGPATEIIEAASKK